MNDQVNGTEAETEETTSQERLSSILSQLLGGQMKPIDAKQLTGHLVSANIAATMSVMSEVGMQTATLLDCLLHATAMHCGSGVASLKYQGSLKADADVETAIKDMGVKFAEEVLEFYHKALAELAADDEDDDALDSEEGMKRAKEGE